jgi:hypothetical protein
MFSPQHLYASPQILPGISQIRHSKFFRAIQLLLKAPYGLPERRTHFSGESEDTNECEWPDVEGMTK